MKKTHYKIRDPSAKRRWAVGDAVRSAVPLWRGSRFSISEEDYKRETGRAGFSDSHALTGELMHLHLPTPDSATGRTVRMHEKIHTHHQTPRAMLKHPSWGWVEDAYVQGPWWPSSPELKDDAIETAHLDWEYLRDEADGKDPGAYGMLLRSMAIFRHYHDESMPPWPKWCPTAASSALSDALDIIMEDPGQKRWKEVCSFIDLFYPPPKDEEGPHRLCPGAKSLPDEEDIAGLPTMKIVDQPKTAFCAPALYPRKLGATSGMRLRSGSGHLVRAILGGSRRVFQKRVQLPEDWGTVLIDASGSMGMTAEMLRGWAAAMPQMTIAYYFGYSPETGGELWIHARDGKRAIDAPIGCGNNVVDLPAMRWLLRQKEPRMMVTDAEFCGGGRRNDLGARILLANAHRSGDLHWAKSLEEASEFLGIRS